MTALLQTPVRFEIRGMTSDDLEKVLEVERQCHTHPWSADLFRRELENPFARVDLLWFENELCGYLCSWFIQDELHILNVATAPLFRRRGIASALMNHVLARSVKGGMERAFLEVRAGNAGAVALYQSFGFATVSRRQRYYADGEDALVMEFAYSGKE
jgi:ribosomal-protein-alanine N-acetyltransferase